MIIPWEQRSVLDGKRYLDGHYIHEEIEEYKLQLGMPNYEVPSYFMEPDLTLSILKVLRERYNNRT